MRFWLFIILVLFLFCYVLSETKTSQLIRMNGQSVDHDEIIDNHLFTNFIDINDSKKKKVFIHIPNERNNRNWASFYDRSSNDLNISICNWCIKSAIHHLSDSYDVILYTNENVRDLIQESNENDLCNVQNPSMLQGVDLRQWEHYCKSKILLKYGGVVMEPYFFWTQCPNDDILFPNDFMILRHVNEGQSVSSIPLIPDTSYFMSSSKNDENLKLYMEYLKYICVNHYSEDHKRFDKTFEKLYALKQVHPKWMGIVDSRDEPVFAHRLFEKENIEFNDDAFCLFIHIPLLKKYTKYGYILKMSEAQIRDSHNFLGEFIRFHT